MTIDEEFLSGVDLWCQSRPYDSPEDFRAECNRKLAQLSAEQQKLLIKWLRIGKRNPWIAEAYDPPFTVLSFEFCRDVRYLAERILQGNWCLGQAFAFENICFINQIDGGDEWLTIKDGLSFESITMRRREEEPERSIERVTGLVECIQRATALQCQRLEYMEDYQFTEEYSLEAASEEQALLAGFPYGATVFRYTYDEYEYAAVLGLSLEDSRWVFRNELHRYILSWSGDGSAVRLEFVAGVCLPQEAYFRGEEIERTFGEEFRSLAPAEQLVRVIPYLRGRRSA